MRSISKLVWVLSFLLLIAGCRGCRQDRQNETPEEKQKKKLRLVSDELRTLPFSKEIVGNSVKQGHWYQTRHKLKANQNDESLTASLYQIDRKERPTTVWSQGLPVEFERDVSIAKGQEKTIEMKVLQTQPPADNESVAPGVGIAPVSTFVRYAQRGLGAPVLDESFLMRPLHDYQYDMLVLSRNPSNHIFWRGLDCIVWPLYEPDMRYKVNPHRIVDISEEELAESMPSELMTMTSVSHMVINDVSLNLLPQSQQDAIVDWLYFGGTILINGPEAVSSIETSVLKDYAPLQQTTSSELSSEQIKKLNNAQTWCLRFAQKSPPEDIVKIKPSGPIPVLEGQLAKDSDWVPELEGLVAERLVGQGRIVMTTFPMNHSAFVNWPSYSALIHNGVLRKPSRYVKLDDNPRLLYDGRNQDLERDARLTTRLRLWARDLEAASSKDRPSLLAPVATMPRKARSFGSWNSESLVVNDANTYLKRLSGITVPSLASIIKWLLAYLVVLVPVNWLFFRMIGRLELAWLAAPVIAFVGVFVIARGVQLDVGFSRSQTSIQLMEVHNGHSRALLSSYHALYSSLTTNYSVVYPQGQGVVSPMPQHRQRSVSARGLLPYRIADEQGSGFQAFPVLSNTTGLVQSEEVVPLGGKISWDVDQQSQTFEVSNQSTAAIRDVVLLGFNPQGELLRANVGTVLPGESATGQLESPESPRAFSWAIQRDDPQESNGVQQKKDQDFLELEAAAERIMTNYPLQAGEWIAVGWTDKNFSELQITPVTSQSRLSTLLLMHAKTASLGWVEHDVRLMPPRSEDDTQE